MKKIRKALFFAAAMMTVSVFGAASAGAVEYIGTPSITTTASDSNVTVYLSGDMGNITNYKLEYFKDRVKVSWDLVKGANSYVVQLFNEKGELMSIKSTNSSTNYCGIGLGDFRIGYKETQKFYVNVWALGERVSFNPNLFSRPAVGSSAFSVNWDLSEFPEFGSPKNITAGAVNNELVISWEDTAPRTDGKKNYFKVIVRDVKNGKDIVNEKTSDTTHKVNIKGLKDGSDLHIRIFNINYDSAVSEADYKLSLPKTEAVTPDKLAAPSNVSASWGDGKATLSWKAVSGADAYRIYKYDEKTGKFKVCKTVKSTKCSINGLKNGTTYKFRVVALVENPATGKYKAGPVSDTVSAKPRKKGK